MFLYNRFFFHMLAVFDSRTTTCLKEHLSFVYPFVTCVILHTKFHRMGLKSGLFDDWLDNNDARPTDFVDKFANAELVDTFK